MRQGFEGQWNGYVQQSINVSLLRAHISQRAIDGNTPIQELKDWQQKKPDLFAKLVYDRAELEICLVSCDHIPRRSWPFFRAKAVIKGLIAGIPSRQSRSNLKALEQSNA